MGLIEDLAEQKVGLVYGKRSHSKITKVNGTETIFENLYKWRVFPN